MSSHNITKKKVPIDRPSKKRIVREKTTDMIKGKRDRRVKKAVKSKRELAPKSKHVRALLIDAWKSNSMDDFFNLLRQEPLNENAVSAYKALVVSHKMLQEGPPKCLQEAKHQARLFDTLRSTWAQRQDRGYAPLIPPYAALILDKLQFHQKHPLFSGNFSYQEYLRRPQAELSVEVRLELVGHLLDYQDGVLGVQKAILQYTGAALTEAKLSGLVPLIVESWGIYTFVVHFLKELCKVITDADLIQYLVQRFYQQYPRIRFFYEDCSHIKYVTSMITVPVLPVDPPEFRLRRRRTRRVKEVEREPPREEPKQLNLAEMEAQIVAQTAAPTPAPEPMVVRRAESVQTGVGVAPTPQLADTSSWVSFNRSPGGIGSGESATVNTATQAKNHNANQENAVASFFDRLATAKPPPKPQVATAGTMAGSVPTDAHAKRVQVNAKSGDQPAKRPLTMNDLKVRLLKLQQLYKKEREKNKLLEAQLAQRDEQIAKWKEAYAKLLMSNETSANERQDLIEINEELELKLQRLENARKDESRAITDRWQDRGEQSVQLALALLNNPTETGIAGAQSEDVLRAREILNKKAALLVDALQKLRDGKLRPMDLDENARAVGDATSDLVRNVKGLWAGISGGHDLTGEEGEGENHSHVNPAVEEARKALFAAVQDAANGSGDLIRAAARAALDVIEGEPESGEAGRSKEALAKLLTELVNQLQGFDKSVETAAAAEEERQTELEDTLTDRASAELAAAAKVIAEAARTLLATKAQTDARSGELSELQSRIAGAIVAAALAIAQATAKLIEHAAVVQKETAGRRPETRDGQAFYKTNASQWARGLISAAQNVAAETQTLVWTADSVCRAATGQTDGEDGGKNGGRGWWMSDEGLVAAAQGVAESTTQLVVAARVRGAAGESQKRLEGTAASVSAATKQLVEAARAAAEAAEQRNAAADAEAASMAAISGAVARMKAVQEAKTTVLRLEKDLQRARQQLFRIRESDYHAAAPQEATVAATPLASAEVKEK